MPMPPSNAAMQVYPWAVSPRQVPVLHLGGHAIFSPGEWLARKASDLVNAAVKDASKDLQAAPQDLFAVLEFPTAFAGSEGMDPVTSPFCFQTTSVIQLMPASVCYVAWSLQINFFYK